MTTSKTYGYARNAHWAFVGAKVVCISVEPMCEEMTKVFPEIGQVYSLRKIEVCGNGETFELAVLLDEIKNPLVGPDYELGFLLSGFRPFEVAR